MCVGWKLHVFLILAPDGGKWLASCPSYVVPGETACSADWTEGMEQGG
jgi:hypothetical protein